MAKKMLSPNKYYALYLRSLIFFILYACQSSSYPTVEIRGAMQHAMWNNALGGIITLDTIGNRKGLYGLGPEAYLTGEIMINDGIAYVSRVAEDSSISIEKTYHTAAPFFVYANVSQWQELELPESIHTIKQLEKYLDSITQQNKRPFAFKLMGQVATAKIHIQNLPKGNKVSSPTEAHRGQVSYVLQDEAVEIVGFFSTEHQGIFTHHNDFLHMHLINQQATKMGHLDAAHFQKMKLYLPLQ